VAEPLARPPGGVDFVQGYRYTEHMVNLLRRFSKGKHMGGLKRWIAALAVACCAAGPASPWLWAADESPQALLESARKAMDRKDHGRAASLARRVVKRHAKAPEAEDAWLVRVQALSAQGKIRKTVTECNDMLAAYPRTKHRTAVLRVLLDVGKRLARSEHNVIFFRLSRLEEGVEVLKSVVNHAPFGPLADDAALAAGDAYLQAADFEQARDHYDSFLKAYPDSKLALRARVSRALCNYRLTTGAAYDTGPAVDAERELKLLANVSGDPELEARKKLMSGLLARGEYQTGLFYVRRGNVEGGMRYMKTVIAKYPESDYARRAKRILDTVRAAQAEEKP